MALAPRAVVVHRRTEYDELLAHHGTRGQAEFFLRSRGRDIAGVDARHAAIQQALQAVAAAIPADWRRGSVERSDLARFLFAPDDVIVVVGQDGLVANTAKYLRGQPVIGLNPEPDINPGVLVLHPVSRCAELLAGVAAGHAQVEHRTMVQAGVDDGQQLLSLNEVYVGHPSHQSARYRITVGDESELQSSSGLLIGTGTGATGWCRSAWQERRSELRLPAPGEPQLCWFVREAWPSPSTGTRYTEGVLRAGEILTLTSQTDGLVVFGDGIESDRIILAWGQSVSIATSPTTLTLVVAA
jgi:hypothetical protein